MLCFSWQIMPESWYRLLNNRDTFSLRRYHFILTLIYTVVFCNNFLFRYRFLNIPITVSNLLLRNIFFLSQIVGENFFRRLFFYSPTIDNKISLRNLFHASPIIRIIILLRNRIFNIPAIHKISLRNRFLNTPIIFAKILLRDLLFTSLIVCTAFFTFINVL